MLPSLIIKILALLFIAYFGYLAYVDYRCREIKRRLVLALYPIIIYLNFKVSEKVFMTAFGFLVLGLTLYVTVLAKPDSFGALDILMAPMVTIWFNEYSIFYSLVLIIANSLLWKLGLVKKLFSLEGEKLSNPLFVIMFTLFLVFSVTVPNNLWLIFSL